MRTTSALVIAALLLLAAPAPAETFLLEGGKQVRGEFDATYSAAKQTWMRVRTPFGSVSFLESRLKKRIRGEPKSVLTVEEIFVTKFTGDVQKSGDDGKTWITLSPRSSRGTTAGTELPRNVPNGRLAPGEWLRTGVGGEADLDVGYGVVHVRPNSELRLEEKKAATMTLRKGEAGMRLDRLPKDRTFRVETPQATMGVRGTTLLCRVGDVTRVAVEEGSVDVGELPVGAGGAAEAAAGAAARPAEQSAADAATFERLRMTFARPRFDWVVVPAGSFERSITPAKDPRAKPLQTVAVPAFEMSTTEVTNEQYEIFWKWIERTNDHSYCHPDEPPGYDHAPWSDKTTNSYYAQYRGEDPRQPVAGVSWLSAHAFCAWAGVRLPSEAEWTYAVRGGQRTRYWWGDDAKKLADHEWYEANCGDEPYDRDDPPHAPEDHAQYLAAHEHGPHVVGTLPPNAFGLHDMLGNVTEFVADLYHADHTDAPTDGSPNLRARGARDAGDGTPRKCRMSMGGSWGHPAAALLDFHVAGRWAPKPQEALNINGFRVAREAQEAR